MASKPNGTIEELLATQQCVDRTKFNIATEFWGLLIELNNRNGAGPFKHPQNAKGIRLHNCYSHQMQAVLSTVVWNSHIGIFTRVGATDSDWASPCDCSLASSPQNYDTFASNNAWPMYCDFSVIAGVAQFATSFKGTTSVVTASTALESIDGVSVFPRVGDVFMHVYPAQGTPALTPEVNFSAKCLKYTPVL
jgi:hypothetical protein